jgi:hypothetical protein
LGATNDTEIFWWGYHGDILMDDMGWLFHNWKISECHTSIIPLKKNHQNRSKWQTINHNQALACAKQSQDTCRSRFGILRLGSFPSPTAGISWEGEISIRIGIG